MDNNLGTEIISRTYVANNIERVPNNIFEEAYLLLGPNSFHIYKNSSMMFILCDDNSINRYLNKEVLFYSPTKQSSVFLNQYVLTKSILSDSTIIPFIVERIANNGFYIRLDNSVEILENTRHGNDGIRMYIYTKKDKASFSIPYSIENNKGIINIMDICVTQSDLSMKTHCILHYIVLTNPLFNGHDHTSFKYKDSFYKKYKIVLPILDNVDNQYIESVNSSGTNYVVYLSNNNKLPILYKKQTSIHVIRFPSIAKTLYYTSNYYYHNVLIKKHQYIPLECGKYTLYRIKINILNNFDISIIHSILYNQSNEEIGICLYYDGIDILDILVFDGLLHISDELIIDGSYTVIILDINSIDNTLYPICLLDICYTGFIYIEESVYFLDSSEEIIASVVHQHDNQIILNKSISNIQNMYGEYCIYNFKYIPVTTKHMYPFDKFMGILASLYICEINSDTKIYNYAIHTNNDLIQFTTKMGYTPITTEIDHLYKESIQYFMQNILIIQCMCNNTVLNIDLHQRIYLDNTSTGIIKNIFRQDDYIYICIESLDFNNYTITDIEINHTIYKINKVMHGGELHLLFKNIILTDALVYRISKKDGYRTNEIILHDIHNHKHYSNILLLLEMGVIHLFDTGLTSSSLPHVWFLLFRKANVSFLYFK